MKTGKKLIGLLLVSLMLASVTGCAGNSTTDTDSSKQESSGVSGDMDPLGKYSEPVVLTTVGSTNASLMFSEGDDIENNVYTRMVKDELNIEIKYNWVVDDTQYDNKLATMLASNTLPDYFVPGAEDFVKLANAGRLYDMTEVYDVYAGDVLKEKSDYFKEGFDSGVIDGKLYGIGRLGFGTISLPQLFWIRTDWLEKCDLDVPTTIDELYTAGKEFVEKCGASFAMTLDKTVLNPSCNNIFPFTDAYHAYPGLWIEKDGKLEYGSIQPEMKEALLELQKWYKDGLIDKEFSVKDTSKVDEDLAAGKAGILGGAQWMGWGPLKTCVENDPSAEWKPIEIQSVDGETMYHRANWPVTNYIVVNKECEHPEAVIKVLNLHGKIEFDGTLNELEVENTWSAFPIYQDSPAQDYNAVVALNEAFETGDTSKLDEKQLRDYNECKAWEDNKDISAYGRYMQKSPIGSYSVIKNWVDDDTILLDGIHGAIPDNYAKVKSTLDQLETETFVKIIMGEDISAFDQFVESWNKLGGENATAEVNEVYN